MRRPLQLLLGVLLLALLPMQGCTAEQSPPPDDTARKVAAVRPWRLVFADEFDSSRLSRKRWTTCYWWADRGCTNRGNRELQWYVRRNVDVAGGELRLEARRESVEASDGRRYRFTSGMVTTGRSRDDLRKSPRFAFTYGRVRVRMRAPAGKGLWSAIWMLPVTHQSRPEIDLIEVLGHRPARLHAHFHYLDGNTPRDPGHSWTGPNASAGWHTYGLNWTPRALVWLVDGRKVWRFTKRSFIPDQRMYLLINLAVGGEWPGKPGRRTRFPSSVDVDYVRVWQRGR